jgi:hypothetical protein
LFRIAEIFGGDVLEAFAFGDRVFLEQRKFSAGGTKRRRRYLTSVPSGKVRLASGVLL